MTNYAILNTQQDVADFQKANQHIEWLSIDTEFIGEKRYQTLLCLVQVATENGLYIFDAIKLPDIQAVIDLMINPDVLKISHAGENDYRLFNELYDIVPSNIFDTQIAAAFVGYRYPISFRALVQNELNIRVSKVQTVTDWERRPIKKRQIQYALDDVIPLRRLYDQLSQKIAELGRAEWVEEEMQKMQQADFYVKEEYREFYNHNQVNHLPLKEKVFLLRLYEWRRQLAEKRDHSKEMVLAKRNINPIVKSVHLGVDGLKQNRRISERFVKRYSERMLDLYHAPITSEEEEILAQITESQSIDPKEELKLEMLYSFVNYRCLEQKIAPEMVLSRRLFKQLKEDNKKQDNTLKSGWRTRILGKALTQALNHRDQLAIEIGEGELTLKVNA